MKTINCQACRNYMVDALYDQLSAADRETFTAHLENCSSCRAEFARLQATLQIMDRRERSRPPAAFWDGFWEQVAAKIDSGKKRDDAEETSPRFIIRLRTDWQQWAGRAAAAAAILIVGILIGRFLWQNPAGAPHAGIGAEGLVQEAALEKRTENYLERSKVLLLGLVNLEAFSPDSEAVDLGAYQEASQGLVKEAVFLKQALRSSNDARLQKLVSDLEVILLQIANLEATTDHQAIEMIQTGVDRNGLLLKINLEEMRRIAAPPAGKSGSKRGDGRVL